MTSVGWWILLVVAGLIGVVLVWTLVRLVATGGPPSHGGTAAGRIPAWWARLTKRGAGGRHGVRDSG